MTMPRTPLRRKSQPRATNEAPPAADSRKRKQPCDPVVIDLCNTSSAKRAKVEDKSKQGKAVAPTNNTTHYGRIHRPGVSRAVQEEWRVKFGALFPTFTFYLDGLDRHHRASEIANSIKSLGARVENFFSSAVTHVVTSRDVNAQPPAKGNTRISPSKPKLRCSPERNPFARDKVDQTHTVLAKAKQMGIKIWDLEKVHRVLSGLLGESSPVKPTAAKQLSLPHLLRAEALSGITHERDPDEKRLDYTYFSSKSVYVLIEDSTGEHRTITAKEYDRPARHHSPEWPVLYGGVEGRCAFSPKEQNVPALPKGAKPIPLPVARVQSKLAVQPPAFLAPPKPGAVGLNSLRKSMSLRELAKKQAGLETSLLPPNVIDEHRREASGFLAASGNSQILTSNVASGTSGAPQAYVGPGANGGVVLDQRLAQMDRRQVTSHVGLAPTLAAPMPLSKQAAAPKLKKTLSMEMFLTRKHLSEPDDPPKPGYCENCRVRYDDFKDHVVSKKHRKFARNPDNWYTLDALLSDVARPILCEYLDDPVFRCQSPKSASDVEADEQSYCSSQSDDDENNDVESIDEGDGTEEEGNGTEEEAVRCESEEEPEPNEYTDERETPIPSQRDPSSANDKCEDESEC